MMDLRGHEARFSILHYLCRLCVSQKRKEAANPPRTESAFQDFDQGGAEPGRRWGDPDAGGLHGGDLRFRVALAAGDDGPGVAHAAARRRRAPDRLLAERRKAISVRLNEFSGVPPTKALQASWPRRPDKPMYDIEGDEVSEDFARCWQAACRHIEAQVQGPFHSWLKASLNPPFLEHLSFRLGNQLFFVRIEDVDEKLTVPGNRNGLLFVAEGCKGHPCIMPMRRRAGTWIPEVPGWGLVDAQIGTPIDPIAFVSDERIEMTDWELQDLAVQVVRDRLEKDGKKQISWQSNPEVYPSIWFVGEGGPEWVVVRAVRYPIVKAAPPANWQQIAEQCARHGTVGHFASVSVANGDDAFDPGDTPPVPLWRGHAMFVRFEGLAPGPSNRRTPIEGDH